MFSCLTDPCGAGRVLSKRSFGRDRFSSPDEGRHSELERCREQPDSLADGGGSTPVVQVGLLSVNPGLYRDM